MSVALLVSTARLCPPLLPANRSVAGIRTVETSLVRDIVHEQNPHGAPVIRRGDCAEALLARSIPDLQLDALAVELNSPDLEIDADGGDERRGERVLAEAQQTA